MNLLSRIGALRSVSYDQQAGEVSLGFGRGLNVPIPGVTPENWAELDKHRTGPAIFSYVETHLASPHWLAAISAPPNVEALTAQELTDVKMSLSWLNPFFERAEAREFVTKVMLERTPCVAIPVKARRSKHGDQRPPPNNTSRTLSEITVNASGNAQQFFITLLHEIAHAEVWRRFAHRAEPHGFEWRLAFQRLLRGAIAAKAFPEQLVPVIAAHAQAPGSSSSRDLALQKALRAYDEVDKRPMVIDLEEGVWFATESSPPLRRGPLLRSRVSCQDQQGRQWRVSSTARVSKLFKIETR